MKIPASIDKQPIKSRSHRELGGYGIRHLVHHLIEGKRGDDVKRLLFAEHDGGNAWYYVKVISCSDLSGYLSDLEIAKEFFLRIPVSEADRATQYGDALIFPLLISEVRGSYKHLTGPLLGAALKHGVWNWGYVAKLVDGLADEQRRLELIAHALPYISGDEKISGLILARGILKKQAYNRWLINTALIIALNLGDGERRLFFRLLWRKIRKEMGRAGASWDDVTYGFKRIAPLLEGRSLAGVLLVLSQYANEEHKIAVLVSVFPRVRSHYPVIFAEWQRRRMRGQPADAVDLAFRIWDPSTSYEQRAELMKEAVGMAFEWRTVYITQTLALVEFVGLFLDALSEDDARSVLVCVMDGFGKCNEAYRAEMISALATWFAKLVPMEILQSVAAFADLEYRRVGLMALVPRLSSLSRSLFCQGRKWTSEPGSLIEFAMFSPFVQLSRKGQESRALMFALINPPSYEGGLLSYLAPHLSESALAQAVEFMERYRRDPSDHGFWGNYDVLLPYLPKSLLLRVLSNIRDASPLEYEEEAAIFALLGTYLPPDASREAMSASYHAFRAFAMHAAKGDLADEAANGLFSDRAELILVLAWVLLIRVHVRMAWLGSIPEDNPLIKSRWHNRWIRSASQRMGLRVQSQSDEEGVAGGSRVVELAKRYIPLVFSAGGEESVHDLYALAKAVFRWRRSVPARESILLPLLMNFAESYIDRSVRLYYVKKWRGRFSAYVLRVITHIYIAANSSLCGRINEHK